MIFKISKEQFFRFRQNIRSNVCLNSELLHNYRTQLEGCSVLMGGLVVDRKKVVESTVRENDCIHVSQFVPAKDIESESEMMISFKLWDGSGFFWTFPAIEQQTREKGTGIREGDLVYVRGKIICLPGAGAVLLPQIFLRSNEIEFYREAADDECGAKRKIIAERLGYPLDPLNSMYGYVDVMEVVRPFLKKGQNFEGHQYFPLLDVVYAAYLKTGAYCLAYLLVKTYRRVYGDCGSDEDFFEQFPVVAVHREYLVPLIG